MPNDREAMKATAERSNPLYTDRLGRGRFYIETSAMWDDWSERLDAVAAEDRGKVLPRSYEQVKAAKMAKEEELARALEAHRVAEAEERAAERERLRELIKVQQRMPAIPPYPPGRHPDSRRSRGQVKWSKRAVGAESNPPVTVGMDSKLPLTAGQPKKVRLKLNPPKKPVGNAKSHKRRGKYPYHIPRSL